MGAIDTVPTASPLTAEEEAHERATSWPRGYTKAEIEAARLDARRLGYGRDPPAPAKPDKEDAF